MHLFQFSRTKLAAATIGGLVVLGGGTAAAFAATGSDSPTSPATASLTVPTAPTTPNSTAATGGAGLGRRVLARSEHTTVEIKRKGQWVTVAADRGTVAAASASSITLTHPDGTTVTFGVDAATKFRGATTTAGGLAVGQRIVVVSDGATAVSVTDRGVAAAKS